MLFVVMAELFNQNEYFNETVCLFFFNFIFHIRIFFQMKKIIY